MHSSLYPVESAIHLFARLSNPMYASKFDSDRFADQTKSQVLVYRGSMPIALPVSSVEYYRQKKIGSEIIEMQTTSRYSTTRSPRAVF